MSLSSQTVAELPLAWNDSKTKTQEKVPPERQIVATADEKAAPEPR